MIRLDCTFLKNFVHVLGWCKVHTSLLNSKQREARVEADNVKMKEQFNIVFQWPTVGRVDEHYEGQAWVAGEGAEQDTHRIYCQPVHGPVWFWTWVGGHSKYWLVCKVKI